MLREGRGACHRGSTYVHDLSNFLSRILPENQLDSLNLPGRSQMLARSKPEC